MNYRKYIVEANNWLSEDDKNPSKILDDLVKPLNDYYKIYNDYTFYVLKDPNLKNDKNFFEREIKRGEEVFRDVEHKLNDLGYKVIYKTDDPYKVVLPDGFTYNVSVEQTNYTPILINNIIKI